MNHLSDRGERAIDLLTKLAYGDLALVRVALTKYGDGKVEDVINYIQENRKKTSPPHPTNGNTALGSRV